MSEVETRRWAQAIRAELTNDIVPFWLAHAFEPGRSTIVGRMTRDLTIDPEAPRGLILATRLLWSFSAFAAHLGRDRACESAAHRAFTYLDAHFFDRDRGGAYWSVDPAGRPLDARKKVYGQAFAIYALAEYHRYTGSTAALARAQEVFHLLESKAHDARLGGYFEAYERDWTPAIDSRLGDDDPAVPRSMNTHLHVLEAYTGLLRSWPDETLRRRTAELIDLFLRKIIDARTHRFHAFFEDDWSLGADHRSPGHDIEGSWLLCEAAESVADAPLLAAVRARAIAMADAVLHDGMDSDGGILNGTGADGALDTDKTWWSQAEAVVGFLNAHELSGQARHFEAARAAWNFIVHRVLDRERGEWFWSVSRDGEPDLAKPKISEWKCPYHNGRMCLEAERRLGRLLTDGRS